MGYAIMPYDNTSCDAELSVSVDRILRAVEETLKTGKCAVEWKPFVVSKDKKLVHPYGVNYDCLMRELKQKLKTKRIES